jgi:HK97 family phage portal protein
MNDLITQIEAGMHTAGVVGALSNAHHPQDWFFDALTWGRSDSGEPVNPRTAMGHGPVWQAINILAGDVGQLPIHVSRTVGDKIERFNDHPVEWLLAHEPNPFQTPATFKETMMSWCGEWGNGCSLIGRNGAGRPSLLVPLLPDRTYPIDVEGEWWIETDFGDGLRIPLPYEDVFHLPWLAEDGFWGVGPIQRCRNTIATGLALRKHGNKTFANGARPGGALEIPGAHPTPEQMREKRAQLEAMHGGADNAARWLLLYNGAKFSQLAMNNDDAQWLEALDLDREFIASIFNLPPYKLGSMKNSSTRANTEQQNTDYLNNSLSRHLNKFREEVRRKLFNLSERKKGEIDVDWTYEAFLRADLAARGAYYAQAKTGEWMTTNEIRKLEGLNPIKGGDVLKNPAINPATPKTDAPPKSDPPPAKESGDTDDRTAARRSARALVAHQVDALIEAEVKAVERACNPDSDVNLVRWSETYYENFPNAAGHFLNLHCDLAASSGCGRCDWRRVACDHARDSLNLLLAMAGIATKSSLPDIGKQFAQTVRDRKEYFANAILGE